MSPSYVAGDIANDEINRTAVDLAVAKFGRLDAVIFNAGVLDPVTRIANSSVSEWRRLYDINVLSIISMLTYAVPHLRKHGGRAVFVSSGASISHYVSRFPVAVLLLSADLDCLGSLWQL
jgi:NAD(P)-dependent dehydrogenase (short-subunit alcohol dehydrogenase family)